MTVYQSITTERLLINQVQFSDIPKVVEYAGNEKVSNNTLNIPHPYSEQDAIDWIEMIQKEYEEQVRFPFAIRLGSSGEFIGSIGLRVNPRFNRAELGYWVAVPFWGNGYATEATQALLHFGFKQLNLNKIFAVHTPENPGSGKVMLNNGMIKEGELVEHFKKGDRYYTVIQYRLTKHEYFKINGGNKTN